MLHAQGKGIAGSPRTVVRFLADQMTRAKCNYCVAQIAFGDQSLDELTSSINLFASHVMPEMRALDEQARRAA
jgi:hypothetical protein